MNTTAKKIVDATHDMVQAGADQAERMADAVPGALTQAAHKVEDLARAGIDKARQASHRVADSASTACSRTTDYVREEPGKSLLIAAAVGAAAAMLVGWALQSRSGGDR